MSSITPPPPAGPPGLTPDPSSPCRSAWPHPRPLLPLQVRLGLTPDPSKPLFAFIGRLEEQKGVDVLLAALPQLLGPPSPSGGGPMFNPQLSSDPGAAARAAAVLGPGPGSSSSAAEGLPAVPQPGISLAPGGAAAAAGGGEPSSSVSSPHPSASASPSSSASNPHPPAAPPLQVAMLGCGQPWLEQALGCLGTAYPGSAVGVPYHSEALAHLMMAGADFLVVPSRYEPCGLVAMCAVRYGTVPVVAPVGGLVDIARGHFGGGSAGAAHPVTRGTGPEKDGPGRRLVSVDEPKRLVSAKQHWAGELVEQGLRSMPQLQLGPKPLSRPAVKTQKPDGPLGYILKGAIGPAADAVGTRRAVATLVSGLLEAAVDYYTSAPERVSGVQALTGRSAPARSGGAFTERSGGSFTERRARCMQADVSWAQAVQQWERVLGALPAGRGGLGAPPRPEPLV